MHTKSFKATVRELTMSALQKIHDNLDASVMGGKKKALAAYKEGYQSYLHAVDTSDEDCRDDGAGAHVPCPYGCSQIGMRCAWMAGWNDADIDFRGRQPFVQRCDDLGIMAA